MLHGESCQKISVSTLFYLQLGTVDDPCNLERFDTFESNYQVPRLNISCIPLAEDQCCTARVFQVDETKDILEAQPRVDVFAFIPSSDNNVHRKYLELRVVVNNHSSEFTLKYKSAIQCIKVIALPTNNESLTEVICVVLNIRPLGYSSLSRQSMIRYQSNQSSFKEEAFTKISVCPCSTSDILSIILYSAYLES